MILKLNRGNEIESAKNNISFNDCSFGRRNMEVFHIPAL